MALKFAAESRPALFFGNVSVGERTNGGEESSVSSFGAFYGADHGGSSNHS